MSYRGIFIAILLSIQTCAFAEVDDSIARLKISEVDGSPAGRFRTISFDAGTLYTGANGDVRYSPVSFLSSFYLPLTGGTLTGDLNVDGDFHAALDKGSYLIHGHSSGAFTAQSLTAYNNFYSDVDTGTSIPRITTNGYGCLNITNTNTLAMFPTFDIATTFDGDNFGITSSLMKVALTMSPSGAIEGMTGFSNLSLFLLGVSYDGSSLWAVDDGNAFTINGLNVSMFGGQSAPALGAGSTSYLNGITIGSTADPTGWTSVRGIYINDFGTTNYAIYSLGGNVELTDGNLTTTGNIVATNLGLGSSSAPTYRLQQTFNSATDTTLLGSWALLDTNPAAAARNWRMSTGYTSTGIFEFQRSTVAGGDPTTQVWSVDGSTGDFCVNMTPYFNTAAMEIFKAGTQLYLHYTRGSVYAALAVNSSGNLVITPTGGALSVTDATRTLTLDCTTGSVPTLVGSSAIYLKVGTTNVAYVDTTQVSYYDNKYMRLGNAGTTGVAARMWGDWAYQQTGGDPDKVGTLTIGLSSVDYSVPAHLLAGRSMIICDADDMLFNFAHPVNANPTVFIHSAAQSTTQWLSLAHDGTNGVIDVGAGGVSLPDYLMVGAGVLPSPTAGDIMADRYYMRESSGTQNVYWYSPFADAAALIVAGGTVIQTTSSDFSIFASLSQYDVTTATATTNMLRGYKRKSTGYPTSGQEIVKLQGRTWNGTGGTDVDTGDIALVADENHTATARGTRLEFYATPNATATPWLMWTMDSTGDLLSGSDGTAAYNITTAGVGTVGSLEVNGATNISGTLTMLSGNYIALNDGTYDRVTISNGSISMKDASNNENAILSDSGTITLRDPLNSPNTVFQVGPSGNGGYLEVMGAGSTTIALDGTNSQIIVGGNGGVTDTYDDGTDSVITFTGGIATLISTPFNKNTVTDKIELTSVLNRIDNIKPYSYKYQGKNRFGFLADEIAVNFPEATFTDRHVANQIGYRKDAMMAIMFQAIKELKAEVELLKAK